MNKNDLRYQKTETKLRSALISLLKRNNIETISVRDICEEAGCSRNAFYLHYETKEDLYEAIITSIIDRLVYAIQADTNVFGSRDEHAILQYYDQIIDAIISHRDELDVLIKRDQGVLMMKLAKAIFAGNEETIHAFAAKAPSVESSLNAAFLSAGIVGFIYEWFTHPGITDQMAKDFLIKVDNENRNIYRLAL